MISTDPLPVVNLTSHQKSCLSDVLFTWSPPQGLFSYYKLELEFDGQTYIVNTTETSYTKSFEARKQITMTVTTITSSTTGLLTTSSPSTTTIQTSWFLLYTANLSADIFLFNNFDEKLI